MKTTWAPREEEDVPSRTDKVTGWDTLRQLPWPRVLQVPVLLFSLSYAPFVCFPISLSSLSSRESYFNKYEAGHGRPFRRLRRLRSVPHRASYLRPQGTKVSAKVDGTLPTSAGLRRV